MFTTSAALSVQPALVAHRTEIISEGVCRSVNSISSEALRMFR
jgi:hypothetical protein